MQFPLLINKRGSKFEKLAEQPATKQSTRASERQARAFVREYPVAGPRDKRSAILKSSRGHVFRPATADWEHRCWPVPSKRNL